MALKQCAPKALPAEHRRRVSSIGKSISFGLRGLAGRLPIRGGCLAGGCSSHGVHEVHTFSPRGCGLAAMVLPLRFALMSFRKSLFVMILNFYGSKSAAF